MAKHVQRAKIFISYSHVDHNWCERERTHLRPLEREDAIRVFTDLEIKPGSKWRQEIKQAIESAKVAILLISANFLASDFIATDELPPLLQAAEERGTRILPLILSPSRFFGKHQLSVFQAVNNKPLTNLSRGGQETALVKLAENVESAFDEEASVMESVRGARGLSQRMTKEDMAWVTGMFEARGSIVIHKSGLRFHLTCKMRSLDRSILEFFHDRWHGGLVQVRPTKGRKAQWLWHVSGDGAGGFLKDIASMMKIDQTRWKTAVAFKFQSVKKGGGDAGALRSYYERMKTLNAYKQERFGVRKRSRA